MYLRHLPKNAFGDIESEIGPHDEEMKKIVKPILFMKYFAQRRSRIVTIPKTHKSYGTRDIRLTFSF
jgi:hypothetical protein